MRALLVPLVATAAACGSSPVTGNHPTTSMCVVEPRISTDFTVRSGAIRGRVCDAASGAPCVGATVVVISPVVSGDLMTITDETGSFDFANLPPGPYGLLFYVDDQTFEQQIIVDRGRATRVIQRVDMRLGRSG